MFCQNIVMVTALPFSRCGRNDFELRAGLEAVLSHLCPTDAAPSALPFIGNYLLSVPNFMTRCSHLNR
jgi:hypothetical protein